MSLTFDAPAMSVSVPKELGWHMILDHELDQLSRSEMGFVGSLGFVGLGAVLGLIPQVVEVFGKLTQRVPFEGNPATLVPVAMTTGDLAAVGAFFGSLVLAIICLVLSGLYHWRNKGLAAAIRKRGKQGFPGLRAVT